MSATRRWILTVGGAAVIIAGAAWSSTSEPKRAREPWRAAAKGFGDPRLNALAYAILAPNPHNMQPWRIRLDGSDTLNLFADLSRLLPETDPQCRQVTIGFGCFLELFRQAAAEQGYRAEVSLFPEGEPQPVLDRRPIAAVTMIEDREVARDPLFGMALARRTDRRPYAAGQPIADAVLSSILESTVTGVYAGATQEMQAVSALRELAVAAWRAEWEHPPTRAESIRVTRVGKAAVDAAPWGVSLTGPMIEAATIGGLVSL